MIHTWTLQRIALAILTVAALATLLTTIGAPMTEGS